MRYVRPTLGVLLLLGIALSLAWLFCSDAGRVYLDREHLHQVGVHFSDWVTHHPLRATLFYIALYIALSLLVGPLWWLQILGGYGFGIYFGVFWSQIAAVIAVYLTVALSHVLVGDWIHDRLESRRARLAALDQRLGHNGLLVVMAIRLMHIMPFGLSNYAIGLTRIRPREAALGTLLGNIPAVSFYVAIGAGLHPWSNWRFMSTLALIDLILLIPLALRYFRPQWFQKIGVE